MNPEPAVAWVIDSLKLGGAERLAVDIAVRPPAGWRVELIALQPAAGPERSLADGLGGRLHQLRMRHLRDLAEFARLVRLLRQLRPALLHTHLDYATTWGSAAGGMLRIPHLATLHVLPAAPDEHNWRSRLRAAGIGQSLRRAQRLIFVSEAQRAAWDGRLAESGHCRVVANGTAAAPPWSAAERRHWRRMVGIPDNAWVVVTVAVVRAAKGWREWLQAAEAVTARCPEARFVWVGAGPEFGALRQAVAASPARAQLQLAGARTDVADWLRGADLFAFPSYGEALPTAVIEAMAQGLPIIATDLPATREVLADSGLYVEVGDAAGLAAHLLACQRHPPAAEQAGQAARARWAQQFSPEAWRERLGEVYGECLQNRAARPARQRRRHDLPAARPRVLMVEFFSRGGLFHYSWQLSQGLARAQTVEVELLTGRRPETAAAPAGVRVLARLWTWNPHRRPPLVPRRLLRAWRGGRYVVAWLQVLRAARRERPKVVLLGDVEHRCDAFFVGRLRRLGRRQGFRVAAIWHNVDAFERNRPGRLVRRLAWRDHLVGELDTVFVHGRALARTLATRTGVRAHAIAHGNQAWLVDQAGPDPGLDQRLALPPRHPVALLFGTLSPYKGVELLLEALARLAPQRRPVAVIAGLPTAGVRPEAWCEQVRRLGLDAWVRWELRYVPSSETAWYFRRADLVVLPYRAASQSGVAHVALTFGKPLIVTDCGGLPELIDGNGLVVETNQVEALAAALNRLCGDARLRQRMGRRSAELAATRHDWQQIGAGMLRTLALTQGAETGSGGATGVIQARTGPA